MFVLFLMPSAREYLNSSHGFDCLLPAPSDTLMAKAGGDFAEILVGKKILGSDQLLQATAVARQTGAQSSGRAR